MAQADNPLVSMIVFCYNQSRFVVESLESVKAQAYKPTELIILDDCSSDESVAVIENWLQKNEIECTFIRHQENQGICKSVNEALSLATGKYLSMIASDDVWLPDKVVRQVEIMESQPDDVGVLYSDAFQIDEHGQLLPETLIASCRRLTEMPQGRILKSLLEGNFIAGQTTLVKRGCYDKVGPYDENLPWEDWDMWMRMARHYSFIYSPIPSAKYRIHAKSYSRSDPIRMLRESCKISLKQFALGGLEPIEESEHTERLLRMSERLYSENDDYASDILLALWQATGNKRAAWMYRFARAGISFRNFQRVDICRARLRRLRDMIRKESMSIRWAKYRERSIERTCFELLLSNTGERMVPEVSSRTHVLGASLPVQLCVSFVKGQRVLDIACAGKGPRLECSGQSGSGVSANSGDILQGCGSQIVAAKVSRSEESVKF